MRFTILVAAMIAVAGLAAASDNEFTPPKGGFKVRKGKGTKFTWKVTNKDEKIALKIYPEGQSYYKQATSILDGEYIHTYLHTHTLTYTHNHLLDCYVWEPRILIAARH